jgi:hypothetical protein
MSQTWKKIGDIVDAVGQGRKQLYQGKEYDYVFDVDIQDGVPPLKLPYNVTGESISWHFLAGQRVNQSIENPFMAAQRFLETNELPPSYVDQVVQFIEKNTGGVNLGSGGEEYVDPYTGMLASFFLIQSELGDRCNEISWRWPIFGACFLLRGSIYWCFQVYRRFILTATTN